MNSEISNHPVNPVRNQFGQDAQDLQDISQLTERVISCAYQVYNTLGFGFLESVYEKSLMVELQKQGIPSESQKPIKVNYDGVIVGDFFADIMVVDRLILELKSVTQLSRAHEVQLVNYLNATGIEDGLLINFGPKNVDIKRKFRTYRVKNKNPVDPVNPVKKGGLR